jgi:ABC-2 type transport system permease protein
MRTLRFILEKEFTQIFRNKVLLRMMLIMPLIQLLILSYAVDYEIKNIRLMFVDQDRSHFSNLLFSQLQGSPYFTITDLSGKLSDANEAIERSACDIVVVVEPDFEKNLYRTGAANVQIIANAIDGTKASLGSSYASSIVRSYSLMLNKQYAWNIQSSSMSSIKQIVINYSYWFNPDLNYKAFMVPGILVLLVTLIGGFLTSMNIVVEKELGTIEQINVTPIRKHHFIIGKTLPFWIIGLMEFGFGLLLGKLVFDIPMVGNLFTLFCFAGTYLFAILGLGLLISTLANTQQQAMFISWFFLVLFILLGGLFSPIENMPNWAQIITSFNPLRYFIEVNRMVLLKGSGFRDLTGHFAIMFVFIIVINGLAIFRYRKTT